MVEDLKLQKQILSNQFDLNEIELVEFKVEMDGRMWLNINGVCAVRVRRVTNVLVEHGNTTLLSYHGVGK